MNEKWKWITAQRLRRGAVLLGAVGLAAGMALSTGGLAMAAVGSGPGELTLSNMGPAPLTTQPTWGTTVACPTGFQGSANVAEFTLTGTEVSLISQTVASPTAPISGALLDSNVGALMATSGGPTATNPGTLEWVVQCWSAAAGTGNVSRVMSLFVTVTSASTYTTSASGPVQVATTTTLTAAPSPAASGGSETLTASVTAADSTIPAGTVQFQSGGTNIGTPVAVNTGGVAAPATTSFTAPTTTSSTTVALTAIFTPTSATYSGSTGSFSLLVQVSGTQTAGAIPVTVTVPATGTLTVTVATTAINLTVGTSTPLTATGALNPVSVNDTRNTLPGWSVSGQDTVFTGSGTAATSTIPGDDLGWTPSCVVSGGAICGNPVAAGSSPGLADAARVLASAAPGTGFGTDTLNAALTLNIPSTALAGPYSSTLTITFLLT